MKIVMTRQRKAIFDIINRATTPLSVRAIYEQLVDKQINITTIYRTLETLLKMDIITKSHINKCDYFYTKKKHLHYMVCLSCQKMFNIPCHLAHAKLNKITDFKVLAHDLVIYGKCKNCV